MISSQHLSKSHLSKLSFAEKDDHCDRVKWLTGSVSNNRPYYLTYLLFLVDIYVHNNVNLPYPATPYERVPNEKSHATPLFLSVLLQ